VEKFILDSDRDSDQSQNLINWSLAEGLSFHVIWFKSVNNFLKYPANKQTDRQTDAKYHSTSATLLAEVTIVVQ